MTDKKLLDKDETLVGPADAAKMLHVTPRTLARMADRGDLQALTLPSGHRRYYLESLEQITDEATK